MSKRFINLIKYLISAFGPVYAPKEIAGERGTKILHFGDVPTPCYPYFKRLIKKIRPDIIIHTGDMADELKVSRIPSDIPKYLKSLDKIITILKNSNAALYLVPGNNDLTGEIKEQAPFARYTEPDSVIEIEGVKLCLCHRVMDITGDAVYYFYGHGPTGDDHSRRDNVPAKRAYFNTFFSPTVLVLPSHKIYYLKNPALIRR